MAVELEEARPGGSALPKAEPLWRRDFILITLASLVMYIAYTMLLPTVPLYVKFLGSGESTIGLVVAAFMVTAVGIRPLVGWALDNIGRKMIFLIGMVIFTVSALSYRWTLGIPMLLAIRLLHGVGWGASTTSSATMASDVIPERRLGEGMGFFGLSITLAIAVGPALGLTMVNRSGFPLLFFTCTALGLASLALGTIVRSKPVSRETRAQGSSFFEPVALRPSLVVLLATFTWAALTSFLALYAAERGIQNIGLFFTVLALAISVARPTSGLILDRFGFDTLVLTGLSCFGVAMIILSQARSMPVFLVAGILYGLGYAAVLTGLQALSVHGLPAHRRGAATGTFYMGFDLGIGVGSIIWGKVAETVGFSNMFLATAIPVAAAIVVYVWTGRGAGKINKLTAS
ncbi:MAG: MFS transporter [Firmicutes bacterium]|nr:MFS transporter [Bacillota bacterium]